VILLSSAATLTVAHHKVVSQGHKVTHYLVITISLALFFLILQYFEYTTCTFTIRDGNYGALFFTLTGFHGAHVFLGTIFLFISIIIYLTKNLRTNKHLFFELSVFYYHFVDVVWLGLYFVVYTNRYGALTF
jgi:cytochrome c oxidase subunit 3